MNAKIAKGCAWRSGPDCVEGTRSGNQMHAYVIRAGAVRGAQRLWAQWVLL